MKKQDSSVPSINNKPRYIHRLATRLLILNRRIIQRMKTEKVLSKKLRNEIEEVVDRSDELG